MDVFRAIAVVGALSYTATADAIYYQAQFDLAGQQAAADNGGQGGSEQLYFAPGQFDRPWESIPESSLGNARLDGSGETFSQFPVAAENGEDVTLPGPDLVLGQVTPVTNSVIVISADDEEDEDDIYEFDISDQISEVDDDEDIPYLSETTTYGADADAAASQPCGCVSAEMVGDMKSILDSVSNAAAEYDPTGEVHSYVNMVNYRLDHLIADMQIASSAEVAGTMCDLVGAMNSAYDAAALEKRQFGTHNDMQSLTPPPTVGYVNLDRMTGRWYQVASSRFVQWSVQHGAHCVVHDFRTETDGSMTMRSAMIDASSGASLQYNANLTQQMPGKFRLESSDAPCSLHPLWVIGLGPIVDGQYQWAILGGPFRMSLTILARDPLAYKALYLADIKQLVAALGYDRYLSQPFRTVHDASCTYPGLLEPVAAPAKSSPRPSSKVTVTVSNVMSTATVSATEFLTVTATHTVTAEAAGEVVTAASAAKSGEAQKAAQDESRGSHDNCVLWIVLGCLLGALLLLLCCLVYCCRRQRRQANKPITATFLSRPVCRLCGRSKCRHQSGEDKEPWGAAQEQGMGSPDHHVIDQSEIPAYSDAVGKGKLVTPRPAAQWRPQ